VSEKASSGKQTVCAKERSCCSKGVEQKLNIKSKTEFQEKFKHFINSNIETTLVSWADQFNGYYIDAIQLGHREFDLMFEKLYGLRFKDNYEIFQGLFRNIQLYHEKGNINFQQALDEFFEKLFVRLFKMLNPTFQFQGNYEGCISTSFSSVEPFGDAPKNLLADLKRHFGASRTFVQGLYAGAKVIENLNKIDIITSCSTDLMRINYCSICAGHLNMKPCKVNCELAYSKCMVNYQEFESEWNRYLNTLIQFGRRLENTLNVENTLGSINYKISDVIMQFQENKISITNKVFEKCNMKKIGKRSIAEDEDDENKSKFKETRSMYEEINKTWKKLASDVKKKIKSLKSYWSKLPKGICRNSNPIDKCWNSTHLIELSKQIKTSVDIKINKNNPVYKLIDLQKVTLQSINNKLISSYNGNGLERFEFDSQASNININGLIPATDEELDYEDDDDYEQKKDDETDMKDDQIDRLTDESNNKDNSLKTDLNQDEEFSGSEGVRKQDNNLENDINNFQPRDASLNSNSLIINASICTLIISAIISQYIITNTF